MVVCVHINVLERLYTVCNIVKGFEQIDTKRAK